MSVSRLFTIIGDANVRRNMTALNIASREAMKSAQIVDFNGEGSFDSALASVRSESSVCIVAAITDLLLSNGDCGTISRSYPELSLWSDRRPLYVSTNSSGAIIGFSYLSCW